MTAIAIRRIDSQAENAAAELAELRDKLSPRGDVVSEAGRKRTMAAFGEPLSPWQVVERICGDVRDSGLDAVLDYTKKLDGADLTADSLHVSRRELAEAHAAADPGFLATVRRIRDNVLRFQHSILHKDVQIEVSGGGYLRQRYVPMRRAGLCIPGGAAAYPSTVIMTAVPAQAAGVSEIAVVAPPTRFGSYNRDLLATCHELGIGEVYRMGGAQAVAALAYGVQGVEQIDKIVGPGNLFVALAKKFVYGEVDIDSIAGPSEVVVVADDTARADYVAADLIAQAEHSPGASILITWHKPLIAEVEKAIEIQLAELERGDLARESLEAFGAMVQVADMPSGAALANEIAPEHLHIQTVDPENVLERIPSAGAAFLGSATPVALGDYVAGPSHVLPTGGTARFASGLSANDFLRAGSVIRYSEQALSQVATDVEALATKEELTAHWASVRIRQQEKGGT